MERGGGELWDLRQRPVTALDFYPPSSTICESTPRPHSANALKPPQSFEQSCGINPESIRNLLACIKHSAEEINRAMYSSSSVCGGDTNAGRIGSPPGQAKPAKIDRAGLCCPTGECATQAYSPLIEQIRRKCSLLGSETSNLSSSEIDEVLVNLLSEIGEVLGKIEEDTVRIEAQGVPDYIDFVDEMTETPEMMQWIHLLRDEYTTVDAPLKAEIARSMTSLRDIYKSFSEIRHSDSQSLHLPSPTARSGGGGGVSKTPRMTRIIETFHAAVQSFGPTITLPTDCADKALTVLLLMLLDVFDTVPLDTTQTSKLFKLLRCVEHELGNQGANDSHPGCLTQTAKKTLLSLEQEEERQKPKRRNPGALKKSPQLCKMIESLQKCANLLGVKVNMMSDEPERALHVLLLVLEGTLDVISVNSGLLSKLSRLLKCVECEVVGQGASNTSVGKKLWEVEEEVKSLMEIDEMTKKCVFTTQETCFPNTKYRTIRSLAKTPRLCTMLDTLHKTMQSIGPAVTLLTDDPETALTTLLQLVIGIPKERTLSPTQTDHLEIVLSCLESEVCSQGAGKSRIERLLHEAQASLQGATSRGPKKRSCEAPDRKDLSHCESGIKRTPKLEAIVEDLVKLMTSFGRSVTLAGNDVEASLLALLDSFLDSCGSDSGDLEGLERVLCLLEEEIRSQDADKSDVAHKLSEAQIILRSRKNAASSDKSGLKSNSEIPLQKTPHVTKGIGLLHKAMQSIGASVSPLVEEEPDKALSTLLDTMMDAFQTVQLTSEQVEMMEEPLRFIEGVFVLQEGEKSALMNRIRASLSVLEEHKALVTGKGAYVETEEEEGDDDTGEVANIVIRLRQCRVIPDDGARAQQEIFDIKGIQVRIEQLVQDMQSGAETHTVDEGSRIIEVMKCLKEAVANSPPDEKVSASLLEVLQCLDKEVSNRGLGASTVAEAVKDAQKVLEGLPAPTRPPEAVLKNTEFQSIEEIVNALASANNYIKNLENQLNRLLGTKSGGNPKPEAEKTEELPPSAAEASTKVVENPSSTVQNELEGDVPEVDGDDDNGDNREKKESKIDKESEGQPADGGKKEEEEEEEEKESKIDNASA